MMSLKHKSLDEEKSDRADFRNKSRRVKSQGSSELTEKEADALGVLLDHMGHEVLIRSEADPDRPAEDVIDQARKETLAWLTNIGS
jgi:hypothetical protein